MKNKPRIPLILGPDGKWTLQPAKQDEFEQLFSKLDTAVADVISTIKPVLKAGGGFDKPALRALVFSTMMERLHGLSKDEMHAVLTSILSDRIMQDIEGRPWGSDKPDLLSGQ